jgi:hypothetical protein
VPRSPSLNQPGSRYAEDRGDPFRDRHGDRFSRVAHLLRVDQRDTHELVARFEPERVSFGRLVEVHGGGAISDVQVVHIGIDVVGDTVEGRGPMVLLIALISARTR